MPIMLPMLPMMTSLEEGARRLGVPLTPHQIDCFAIYALDLEEWNARANLTAISDAREVQVKHFLDSLTCLQALPDQAGLRVVDVGSGAGFPGLPLKIVRDDISLCLMESVGKKAQFLRHMVGRLRLAGAGVLEGRAEDYGRQPQYRQQFDVALARAVAELRILAELTLPLCRLGGLVIAQKRAGIDEEMASAAGAIEALGGAVRRCLPVELPGVEPRQLVLIEKVRPTPPAYPRRAGIPQKRPL